MEILQRTLLSILASIFLQIIVWRLAPPRSQILSTLKIFFVVALSVLLLWPLPLDAQNLYFALTYMALTFAYGISFTMVAAESPSQTMLLALAKAGERGLTREELEFTVNDDQFLHHRLDLLLSSRHLQISQGRYLITRAGERYLIFFLWPRRILGIERRGG